MFVFEKSVIIKCQIIKYGQYNYTKYFSQNF